MGRLLVAIALALLATGCPGPDAEGPFAIQLTLDTELGGCSSDRCTDFGMSCGAVVSVRIVAVESGTLIASVCADIPASDNLCGLSNLPPGSNVFFDLPPEMLRIEVATWNRDELEAAPELGGECPNRDIFDLQGIPLASFSPQPAFAGAIFFDAGSNAAEALVPLACTDPFQLDTAECAPPLTQLTTAVQDAERLRQVTDGDADDLLVRAARPRTRIVEDQMVTIIDTAGAWVLERDAGEGASFSTFVSETVSGEVCSLVLEQTAQATTSVVCAAPPTGTERIDLDSALLPKVVLDQVLGAVGLSEFPDAGLVVGRAFDQDTGEPLAGVSLEPEGLPPGSVEYLNSSRTGTLGDQTFDNGYFIARDVPFGTRWDATSDSGAIPARPLVAGVIQGHVTVLMVPLQVP